MLSAIRAFAKSPYAAVLIGLLIISFAVFGAHDMFRAKVGTDVITAGSRAVSPADFKKAFDDYKGQVEQRVGQQITPELAAENGLDRQVLQGLATREAFAALLTKIGLRPSDKQIAEEIQKIPAFFDQVTGRFDKQSYLRRLADNGLTAESFDARVRDGITEQQIATGLVAGLRAPRAYTALAAIYAAESRDMGYFTIEPQTVAQPPQPTDAQLTQFMKENATALTRPEFRQLTVVRFSPSMVSANIPIDEAELKKWFEFRKDTLSSPETRTVIQIPVKTPAAATQITQGLAKGEDAAALAKAAGVEAITYENKPQSAIPDHKVAAAAFQTPAGQAVLVKGDLGTAIVKVVSVTKGHAVTLDEVRPALEAELRKDAATEKVYALTQAYDDAHQSGANLAAAAQKAGVPAVTLGPLAQNGRDMQGQPVEGLSQKLMETAWSLPAGGESEVEDAGNGEYFAVRVDKIIPPAMPPLAEVKPKLIQVWMQRELAKAMEARATSFADRIKKGESLEAVAKAAGASVTQAPGIDRRTAGQNPMLSQDMLGKLFTSRPGDVFTAQANHFAYVVGKLEAIHTGDIAQIARSAEDMRPQMTQAFYREFDETAHTAARQKVKVTIDYNRARQAIGLEPIDPKAASASREASKPGLAK
jgi:peptidyl-prolyl cis-trans isomerase D